MQTPLPDLNAMKYAQYPIDEVKNLYLYKIKYQSLLSEMALLKEELQKLKTDKMNNQK
ncbi:hypothetical protein [Acinetobacter pittii]|uniref:hypothetical protein n=1 Tax=Acinetobacter pittii TaxID=48296 RepID=UPI00238026B2|nr:hypothetical protein [Acinetobacter pittii]MDE4038310.1 hypothetical protein [Acinetobacter pittii]WPP88975.1 hypothetical protein SOI77_02790 [Acinetobacter pittii]